MTISWVVVASASKVKIFAVNKIKFLNDKEKLKLLTEFSHPESRMRDSEIVADKPGRYRSKNMGADSFNEATEPKKNEMDIFAREIVKHLETGRVDKAFHDLILVVAPSFYGLLNSHMHQQLKGAISLVIEKDYAKDSDKELEKHLKQQIG
jgi:protein required for attachment to host cells